MDGDAKNISEVAAEDEHIAWLASLNAVNYRLQRKTAAAERGFELGYLDAAVSAARKIAAAASQMPSPQGPGDERGEKISPRQRLIQAALESGMIFWHDQDAVAYATVQREGRIERHKVQSSAFKMLLRSIYADRFPEVTKNGIIPGSIPDSAMREAIQALEGLAYQGEERKPRLRSVLWGEALWIDLGDPSWRLIKVTAEGWEIVDAADVPLVRTSGMRALPIPNHDAKALDNAGNLLNVAGDDLKLTMAWLVAALYPAGPYPILAVDGEQGSGKTGFCLSIRNLVDPNKAGLRPPPRKEDEMLIAASNSRVNGYDNMSFISNETADALCRISTGTGFGKRTLYTDGEEFIVSVCGPIILNGIPNLLSRADLADRSIALTLPFILPDKRLTEADLQAKFGMHAPGIFELLIQGLVSVLANLPTTNLKKMPRMADFAKLACAASPAFGWKADDILAALNGNIDDLGSAVVDADLVTSIILDMLTANNGKWEGTAAHLLMAINQRAPSNARTATGWPKDATRMSGRLRRAAPALRRVGFEVDLPTKGGRQGRIITISPAAKTAPVGGAVPVEGETEFSEAEIEFLYDESQTLRVEQRHSSLLAALEH